MASFDLNPTGIAQGIPTGPELDDNLDTDHLNAVDDYPDEADYYSLLGLSSKPPPTDSQIRSAYHNLSLSFHPDKQPAHRREAAERQFNRIQEAYYVLIDPKKRVVYDMMGSEGVKREWSGGGLMGKMGKRARGTISVGINAAEAIRVDEDDGNVTLELHKMGMPKVQSLACRYQFKTPLLLPGFDSESEKEEDDTTAESKPAELADADEQEPPAEVIFSMGAAGVLGRTKQKYIVEYEGGSEEEIEVAGPPIMVGNSLHLGATIVPNFQTIAGMKGIWHKRPLSFIRDSNLRIEATALPDQALKATIARNFQPIPGVTPFQVTASSTIKRSLWQAPPSFDIQATKLIAREKLGFCSWSSGAFTWPDFLFERFNSIGPTEQSLFEIESEPSNFQIGLIALPPNPKKVIEIEEDADADGEEEAHGKVADAKTDNTAVSWRTFMTVSPGGAALVLSYSRNIFSGIAANDPVRSEWSSEGYYPMPKMEGPRALRLEVSGVLGMDASLTWSVKATRRVSEFTKVGLGVGLAGNGVVMTVHWNRLGQNLTLPITVCSPKEANHDAALLAGLIPMALYGIIEFVYIRPRDRRKRREQLARRHNALKKLIPKKREESLQDIELLRDQVLRRQAREESQNGLVIRKAEYGYIPPKKSKTLKPQLAEPRVIDVTIPVANLVDHGQLNIRANTVKFNILGFYDPAPLLPKRLKIWYTYQGREHFVDAGEKEDIACPLRAHIQHT
ncbi:hypothetical protein N7468_008226 [Penicillium chermesinum]|uniref:J domain-containing protein n=1 Tax=Penicillium chermesinum TaxID=63820 RepID=A0A9W9TIF6_9EURO|nr:uncharacterized protein N7468_008226 [Penicillium chermesinum]KAJ5223684.1 hypothetical protein N7468_008226 [Penicillium chermesinum]